MPVYVIDTIKPKNDGNFPVVDAIDVYVEGYNSLADAVTHFATDTMIQGITAVLSGKADTSDLTAAVTGLQNQIDELINPVTQDAEVQNARVDYEGGSHTTLKQRLDYEMQINSQNNSDIINYIADIDGRKRFDPSDYEQGSISAGGDEGSSNKFVRTISYVPSDITKIYISSGSAYVKVYKNNNFIGNYNPNGQIAGYHNPWTTTIDLSYVYTTDPEYRIRVVFTNASSGSSATITADIKKLYSVEDSELSDLEQTIIKRRVIEPENYDYTIANVKNQGEYTITRAGDWIDYPDGFSSSAFIIMIVYDYHNNYSLQTAYSADLKRTARRIIRHSGEPYTDWIYDDVYIDTGEPESDSIVPADYEQGGINVAGNNVDSDKYIRSKSYISSSFNILVIKTGLIYVKVYKNNNFVGTLEPDGSVARRESHTSLTGIVDLSPVYTADSEYKIRIVYSIGPTTVVDDIVNVKGYNTNDSNFSGAKVSIYGDSISTFAGYIPEDNKVYYTGSNSGVSSVTETWWYQTITALNAQLYVNNSWSGRCVSNRRDDESEMTDSGAWRQSEVDKLSESGVAPDIIIVKLGINDFNYSVGLGTYDAKSALPVVTEEGPSTFREAYAIMLDKLMTTYPRAKIYCCTLNQCERSGNLGFPEINGHGNSISEFNDAIVELASAFGAAIINHSASGMTYYNLSTYAGDYSSQTGKGLHPNKKGMALLSNVSIKAIDPSSKVRF